MQTLEIKISCQAAFQEIILAELAEIGFNSFLEEGNDLMAYCYNSDFNEPVFKQLMEKYGEKTALTYTISQMEEKNWNTEWESNFEPIEIDQLIRIRAPFHEPTDTFTHELVIIPKMSFGTGHHETTEQCLRLQAQLDHKNKKVLDVGTGTGILSIFAEKLGATEILAFDIDTWCVENTQENIELNQSKKIEIIEGTIKDIKPNKYDIVLANINKNILLSEIPTYASLMQKGSFLIISGFYENDLIDIEQVTEKANLKKVKALCKNNWMAVVLQMQ